MQKKSESWTSGWFETRSRFQIISGTILDPQTNRIVFHPPSFTQPTQSGLSKSSYKIRFLVEGIEWANSHWGHDYQKWFLSPPGSTSALASSFSNGTLYKPSRGIDASGLELLCENRPSQLDVYRNEPLQPQGLACADRRIENDNVGIKTWGESCGCAISWNMDQNQYYKLITATSNSSCFNMLQLWLHCFREWIIARAS